MKPMNKITIFSRRVNDIVFISIIRKDSNRGFSCTSQIDKDSNPDDPITVSNLELVSQSGHRVMKRLSPKHFDEIND